MSDTKFIQTKKDVFAEKPKPTVLGEAHGGVIQDKRAGDSARTGTNQPYRPPTPRHSLGIDNKFPRPQNYNFHPEKLVPITFWTSPIKKKLIMEKAHNENLSLSQTTEAIVNHALEQDTYTQCGAFIEPILEKGNKKNLDEQEKHTLLLAHLVLEMGKMRGMTTNTLRRMPGVDEQTLISIDKESGDSALENATRITPIVSEVMKRLATWIQEKEKKEGK